MPIGFDTGDSFPVQCSLDEGKPNRVTLHVRVLSEAEVRKITRLVREAEKEKDRASESAKLNAALLIGIVGWSLSLAMADEGLDESLSRIQKYVLANEYPALVELAEIEKKASCSPPISGAASSANPAAAENAPTPQPPTAP